MFKVYEKTSIILGSANVAPGKNVKINFNLNRLTAAFTEPLRYLDRRRNWFVSRALCYILELEKLRNIRDKLVCVCDSAD